VQVLNTGGALSYRIPLDLLLNNDDMAGVAALGIPLSPTDPVIGDTGSGQAGNWDEQLGDVDYVQFFPSNTCVQAGTCRYQLRGLDGLPIAEAGFGDIVLTGSNPSADAVDDYRGFALGAGPYRIDVAANDLGTSNLEDPPTQLEVVAVIEGDGNAEIQNVNGVDVLRYRPITTLATVGRVRYRITGCGGTHDTAVATFAIGVFALEDDVLTPDSPGVERIGNSYRIPYSLLWQNDALDFDALSAMDPVIVDQGTAQGGAWSLKGVDEFMTFGHSNICGPSGTCVYGLRDAQGKPILDDTATITFTGSWWPPPRSPTRVISRTDRARTASTCWRTTPVSTRSEESRSPSRRSRR
jgi:hypothetical protein